MSELGNDTLLRALAREPTEYTPIWLMRQAGRYLPEYTATRSRAGSFLALAKNPALATEVTLQPLERFPLDAAILFSDILTVPDAMGLGLYFARRRRPALRAAVARRNRDRRPRRTGPDARAALCARRGARDSPRARRTGAADRLLGQPVHARLLHGGGLAAATTSTRSRPCSTRVRDLLHRILDINARAVTDYLNAQIEAGAQAVMVFDTWGGNLQPCGYQEFSLPTCSG